MSASNSAVPSPRLNVSSPLGLKVSPDAPRRRLTSETLKGGGISGSNPNTVNDLQDKITVQSLHDRSKHMAELKRELFVSALGSGHKKFRSKPEKPKWQFYLSFFFKICLLLVAILWLGLLIWKWRNMLKYSRGLYDFDSDGRLSEVKTSLKNTARRLQAQLDVVDKKIGTEVGVAKKELNKQVEEKDLFFEKKLKWFLSLTDDLDNSLSEIKAMGYLSKEELQIFSNKFKDKEKCSGGSNHEILDDIRNFAKEIVEKEIEKHAADGLGRVDYALASGGAKVINHSKPYLVGKSRSWLAIGSSFNRVHPDPNAKKILEPSFGEPGQCFALHGNNGFVEIKLRSVIVPEAVTLEHVSKMVAYDRLSAPKDCTVTAWFEGSSSDPSNASEKKFILAEFSYSLEKSNAQTFHIQTPSECVNVIRLDFFSNHGSSTHTCIYRFRVHGSEPTSLNVSAQGKEKN